MQPINRAWGPRMVADHRSKDDRQEQRAERVGEEVQVEDTGQADRAGPADRTLRRGE
ncbi:hypothetical protein D3C80_816440 [compost metagenome]